MGYTTVALEGWARVLKGWLWDTRARYLLGIAFSLGMGWLAIRGMDWGLVADQLRDFPFGWAVASVAIFVLASVIRAYRWQVLFVDGKVPVMRLFLVQNVGIGLNNMLPVRVVSEGAQFALLTLRYGVRGGTVLATMVMERILDMVVTASLLMAGLTLLPDRGNFLMYVVGAFVFAMGSVVAVPVLVWAGRRTALSRIPLLVSTATYMRGMTRAKVTLSYSFLLTLAHWLLVGICAWVLAHGMGLEISPFVATLAILGTLYFATALPALPAAAGTFEFAVVYVLRTFDVPHASAFSYALVVHAVIFLPPIIVTIVLISSIGLRPLRQGVPTGPMEEGGAVAVYSHEEEAR